jgi:hypothetical protein
MHRLPDQAVFTPAGICQGHESAATAPPWGDPKQARSYAALARRYLTILPVVRIEAQGPGQRPGPMSTRRTSAASVPCNQCTFRKSAPGLMPCLRRRSYAPCMSDSPLSRQEIYAAAAAHDELGPDYSDAVVASFIQKVDKEIDARVDARLAGMRQPAPPAERDDLRTMLKGVAIGIGASGIAFFAVGGNADERLHRVIWALLLLMVICTAAAGWAGRRLGNRRGAIPRPGRPAE